MNERETERERELREFRTTTLDGYPTFDLEKYYNSLDTAVLKERLRFTEESLARYPNFGTKFYSDFADYLRKKISERESK